MGIDGISQIYTRADVNKDGRIDAEDLKSKNCDEVAKAILNELGIKEKGGIKFSNVAEVKQFVNDNKIDLNTLVATSKAQGKQKPSMEVQTPSTETAKSTVQPEDIQDNHIYKKGDFSDVDMSKGTTFEEDGPMSSNSVYKDWEKMETKEFNDKYNCLSVGAYDINADLIRRNSDFFLTMNKFAKSPEARYTEDDFKNLDDESLLRKFMAYDSDINNEQFRYSNGSMASALQAKFGENPPRVRMLLIEQDFCNVIATGNASEMGWIP